MRELRLALRSLLRQPTFSLSVAATLALATGVASGFFGVVNAIVLRPVPGVEAPGLVTLHVTVDGALEGFSGFSHPTFLDLGARARTLGRVEAFAGRGFALDDEDGGGVVGGQLVSGGFFGLLGTRAMLGRLLGPEDDRPGAEPVVVVTEALWRRRLEARPDVVGRRLRVNGRPFTIVGVTGEGFRGHFVGFPLDLYAALAAAPAVAPEVDLASRADTSLELLARLRPGATLEAARAEMAGLAAGLSREHPSWPRRRGIAVSPWTGLDADLRGPVLGFVTLLLVVGALVLLVACANVGGLVLARGAAREREMAVRAALGASRAQLLRPLWVETLALFVLGGLAGAALSWPAARSLHAFLPEFPIPLHLDVRPDWRVALFAGTVTLMSGLLFGLAPALGAARVDVAEALRRAGRSPAGVPLRARRAFVAAQMALSLVLLAGAGLFLRELQRARAFDPGFRPHGAWLVTVDPALVGREPPARRAFYEAWLGRARAHSAIEAAALARRPPLGFAPPTTRVLVPGLEPPEPEGFPAAWNAVSPGYFATLEIPILSGRDFEERDVEGAAGVAAISRATGQRLFPGREPLGRQILHEGRSLRVVAVVGNVAADRSGRRDGLALYLPASQRPPGRMSLVFRARGAPPLHDLRHQARLLDPGVPVLAAMSLRQHAGAALFPQRLAAAVTSAFAGFALLLAGVGLYGVAAFLAEKQRFELAVRAALGAGRADLRRLVLGRGLRPLAAGLAAGLAGAAGLGHLARDFVPGVGAFDAWAFVLSAGLLASVALLAADLPARRAAAARPMDLLRGE